ncbi:MAG: hypothetical protein V3T72_13045, partial [Thermoanaerobaculia bacterium]
MTKEIMVDVAVAAAAVALILAGVAASPWATSAFAVVGWCGLRLARAPGLRSLFGEKRKTPGAAAGAVVAREVGLAVWVFAAVHGLAGFAASAEIGYLPRASALFLVLLVTAFLEGDVDCRASALARWILIAIAILTHLDFVRTVVSYLHDATISELLATAPVHLGLLLPTLVVVSLFAAALVFFALAWRVRLPLINDAVLFWLGLAAAADPELRRFFEWRHRGHRIVHWPPLAALRSTAVALWEALFGDRDGYLPRAIVPDRCEIFLGDRLRKAEQTSRRLEMDRRPQWLQESPPTSGLRQALTREAVAF